jgi:hypothetical protein
MTSTAKQAVSATTTGIQLAEETTEATAAVASNANLAGDVGAGVGNIISYSGIIPATFGFFGDIVMAIVILICVILIAVGVARFFSGDYQNAFILALVGGGVIAGSIWWSRRAASKVGRGEDDEETVVYISEDVGEEFEDPDYLQVEDAPGAEKND